VSSKKQELLTLREHLEPPSPRNVGGVRTPSVYIFSLCVCRPLCSPKFCSIVLFYTVAFVCTVNEFLYSNNLVHQYFLRKSKKIKQDKSIIKYDPQPM
jgi:hypothetical protein